MSKEIKTLRQLKKRVAILVSNFETVIESINLIDDAYDDDVPEGTIIEDFEDVVYAIENALLTHMGSSWGDEKFAIRSI